MPLPWRHGWQRAPPRLLPPNRPTVPFALARAIGHLVLAHMPPFKPCGPSPPPPGRAIGHLVLAHMSPFKPCGPSPPPCRAIGDLVLVYKRVTGLAGHTSRVSELLERVSGLASADEEGTMRSLYLRWVGGWVGGWRVGGGTQGSRTGWAGQRVGEGTRGGAGQCCRVKGRARYVPHLASPCAPDVPPPPPPRPALPCLQQRQLQRRAAAHQRVWRLAGTAAGAAPAGG